MFPIRNLVNNLRFSNSYPQSAIKGVLIKDQAWRSDIRPQHVLQLATSLMVSLQKRKRGHKGSYAAASPGDSGESGDLNRVHAVGLSDFDMQMA